MVVPLEKQQMIHTRYEMLATPRVRREFRQNPDNEIRGLRYVSFIKELPIGKVKDNESSRLQTLSQPALVQSPPTKMKTQNPLGEVHKIKKKNEEIHAKKLKEIEECMFQSKQEERELKRIEGDIIQRGKKLKKTIKDYEQDVYKEQRKEDDQILRASKGEMMVKQQTAIDDIKLTKDKIHRNTISLQKEKETDSKITNSINGLEFRYGNVADAIKLKRTQINQLVKEFENKVRQQEEEEFRLKQEFAKLTLEMNMEAHKQRVEGTKAETLNKKVDEKNITDKLKREGVLNENLKYQRSKASKSENGTRRLSREKAAVVDSLNAKGREDGRRLKDVKVKIQGNAMARKQARIKGDLIQRERLGMQSSEKVLAVTANREQIQNVLTDERRQKNDLSMDQWRQRHFKVNHEYKLNALGDGITHIQKNVSKQEGAEHELFNQVKKSEYDRMKHEQTAELMKQELLKLQRQHKILLLETEKKCKLKEKEIEERLRKEEAQLGKALSEREEKIQTLNKCRSILSDDKHMLDEEKKIRDRLCRIEQKSTLLNSSQEM